MLKQPLIIFLRRPKSFILRVETIDGSANEGEDYIAVNEILTFEPYETEKEVGRRRIEFFVFSLFTSRKKSLSSDRCDNCGRQPVGARRGVLPQVDDAAGLGVSGINLSPFCHHCQLLSLAIVLVNMVNDAAGPRERGGQAWQDQYHGDYDPQR